MTVSGDGGVLEVRVGSATGNILASQKIAGTPQQGRAGGFGRSRMFALKSIHWYFSPQTVFLFIAKPKFRQLIKKHLTWQHLPMLQLFLLVPIKLPEGKNPTGIRWHCPESERTD